MTDTAGLAGWRKSRRSIGNGECAEVAATAGACAGAGKGIVGIRDTADREGFTLITGSREWREFAARVKRDEACQA